MKKISLVASSLILVIASSFGQAQTLQHSGQPPQLIELYTSEGCSSCPPADRFISQFLDHPQLWTKVVPLAFHVDYWDYLGWQDRFAQPQFKQRQYNYRRQGRVRSVYTPGWIVDAQEWRGFFRRQQLPSNSNPEAGTLTADIDSSWATVQYQPLNSPSNLEVHMVLLGFDRSSQVTAGENQGRRLSHQFVVLDKQQQPLTVGKLTRFDLQQRQPEQRYALAFWVTQPGKVKPIQLVADWLE